MQFEFATAGRIVFRAGASKEAAPVAREFGSRALVVTGKSSRHAQAVVESLHVNAVASCWFAIEGEPTVDHVRKGAQLARDQQCEVVIGIGGGGALDGAKAISILATHSGEPLDYLEVVGKGQPFAQAALPCIAIPTTAGTGAEVTRNAVLGSPQHGLKASLRGAGLLPKVAIVDPVLTLSLPPDVSAYTGMDALTQLLEPYVSVRANALVDVFCEAGLQRVRHALTRVVANGDDLAAREDMSFASLLSGLSLANAGLGVVHGFAAPLGGMLTAPHGAIIAAVLPHAVSVNIAALQQRDPTGPGLRRYAKAAELLTGHADLESLPQFLQELLQRFGLCSLSALGLKREQRDELVDKAARANSMKANPIVLTREELSEIVERAF